VYASFEDEMGNFQYQQLNQLLLSGQSVANNPAMPNCIGINLTNEYQEWLRAFIEFERTNPCNRECVARVARRLENFS